MRTQEDLQDVFTMLEAKAPSVDAVLAPRAGRGLRAWAGPAGIAVAAAIAVAVPVIAVHHYQNRAANVSPAAAVFNAAIPAPVGNAGFRYGFTVGTVAGCSIEPEVLTRSYQRMTYACDNSKVRGSINLFYKGIFDASNINRSVRSTVSGLPAYTARIANPDGGGPTTALLWQYAPDAWAAVTSPAQVVVNEYPARIAAAIKPGRPTLPVPLRFDLAGFELQQVGFDGVSGRMQLTTSAGSWDIAYNIGVLGPFPDSFATASSRVQITVHGHKWVIYRDRSGAAVGMMAIENSLTVTFPDRHTETVARLTTLASKITFAPVLANPATWFNADD